MTAQIVEIAGQKIAMVPFAEYERLLELAEDQADVAAAERAERRRAAGEEEYVPFDLVKSIIDGESALRAWRNYRGFSRDDLASRSGVPVETIAGVEDDGADTLSRNWRLLAEALAIDIEDIIPAD